MPDVPEREPDPDLGQHPRGTLLILLVFGVLFAAGWLAFLFGIFPSRGLVSD